MPIKQAKTEYAGDELDTEGMMEETEEVKVEEKTKPKKQIKKKEEATKIEIPEDLPEDKKEELQKAQRTIDNAFKVKRLKAQAENLTYYGRFEFVDSKSLVVLRRTFQNEDVDLNSGFIVSNYANKADKKKAEKAGKIYEDSEYRSYNKAFGYHAFVGLTDYEVIDYLEKKHNFHEVIVGTKPRKVFFDLDFEHKKGYQKVIEKFIIDVEVDTVKSSVNTTRAEQEEIDNYKSTVLSEIAELNLSDMTDRAVKLIIQRYVSPLISVLLKNPGFQPLFAVFTRHREGKNSYRITCENAYLDNSEAQKIFMKCLRTISYKKVKIPEFLFNSGIIDDLSKSLQSFSLPFHYNKGFKSVLNHRILDEDYVMFDFAAKKEELARRYMVTLLDNCGMELIPLNKNSERDGEYEDISDEKVKETLKIFAEKCPAIAKCFSYRKSYMNILNFDRLEPSYCDICDREHEKDNTLFLIKLRYGILRGCMKTPKKTVEVIMTNAKKELETIIRESKNTFDLEDNYYFKDFLKFVTETTFNSLEEAKISIASNARRVLAYTTFDTGYYIKRENSEDPFNIVTAANANKDLLDFIVTYRNEDDKNSKKNNSNEPIEMPFKKFIKKYSILKLFSNYNVLLTEEEIKDDVFDVFVGFKAKQIDITPEVLKDPGFLLVTDIIKNVWANGNEEHYRYILGWLRATFTRTSEIIGKAIYITGDQGAGKSCICEFMRDYVFGPKCASKYDNMAEFCATHDNKFAGRRMFWIDELTKDNETTFRDQWGIMKSKLTNKSTSENEKTIKIKQKKMTANGLLFDNGKYIYIEPTDRRYNCFKAGDCYLTTKHPEMVKWWNETIKTISNQKTGNIFYSYVLSLDPESLPDPRTNIKTNLKDEIIEMCLSTTYKYCRDWLAGKKPEGYEKKISASELYQNYKTWCNDNGERPKASRFFYPDADKMFKSEIVERVKYYTYEDTKK